MSDKHYFTNQTRRSSLRDLGPGPDAVGARAWRRCSCSVIGVSFWCDLRSSACCCRKKATTDPVARRRAGAPIEVTRRGLRHRLAGAARSRRPVRHPGHIARPGSGAYHEPGSLPVGDRDLVPCGQLPHGTFFPQGGQPMTARPAPRTLDRVAGPADLKALSDAELARLADEVRAEVISSRVSRPAGIWGRRWAWSN